MKHRYFAELSFKGTHYHGWQIQSNANTVQEVLNKCFSTILHEPVHLTGAGRTDTGVHAKSYAAHFETEEGELHQNFHFLRRINGFLPKDIAISRIRKVIPDAHARYSAISRSYEYVISLQKNPFHLDTAFQLYHTPDLHLLSLSAQYFIGEKDFAAFSKKGSNPKNTFCEVMNAEWLEEEAFLIFRIRANRFLRNMVRSIVGTCLEVERKLLRPEDIPLIFSSKNRSEAGESVPAHGLHLTNIEYPDNIFS